MKIGDYSTYELEVCQILSLFCFPLYRKYYNLVFVELVHIVKLWGEVTLSPVLIERVLEKSLLSDVFKGETVFTGRCDVTFPFNHNALTSFIYSGLLVPESSFVWNNVGHCFLLCAHVYLAQGKDHFVFCDLEEYSFCCHLIKQPTSC